MSCAWFWPMNSPKAYNKCHAIDLVAVGSSLKVINFYVVWADVCTLVGNIHTYYIEAVRNQRI